MPGDLPPQVNATEQGMSLPDGSPTKTELATYRYLSSEFAKQIKAQKLNIFISGAFCIGVLFIGLIGTVLLYRRGELAGSALEYMKLAPAALSSISLPFPLRAYLHYRIRMPIYTGFKQLFDEAIENRTRVEQVLVDAALNALKVLH
jgi:hypothetical protein